MFLRWLGLACLLLPLLAGCLGPAAKPAPPSSGPKLAAAPCDARVEPTRVRAREIDLAADPNNRDRLAAGMMVSIPSTRQNPPDDEPVWTRLERSTDGGKTWKGADLSGWPGSPNAAMSPFVGSAIVGDPVLAFLPDGTLLFSGIMIQADYNYAMFTARFVGDGLDPSDVVVFSRGAYGDPALNAAPSPGSVLYNDKQDIGIDPATGVAYVSWMWRFNDPQAGTKSIPVVVMSKDGGKSWTNPKTITGGLGGGATSSEGNIGENPFVTKDGQTHIVWYGSQGGTLKITQAPSGTTDFATPRQIASGIKGASTGAAIGIPIPSVAVGPGPDGTGESVYIVWVDARSGDADIFLLRSTDEGATWSAPVRVNSEPVGDHTDQMVPVVAVSPRGVVGVHYISFTQSHDRFVAEAALSTDGGTTFSTRAISSVPTVMANATGQRVTGIQPHVGDYFGAAFTKDEFVAMWQDGRDGTNALPFTTAYACRLPLAP